MRTTWDQCGALHRFSSEVSLNGPGTTARNQQGRGVAPAGPGSTAHSASFARLARGTLPGTTHQPENCRTVSSSLLDPSPLDLMVWGFLKDKVPINKPANPQELKAAIRREMRRVTVDQVGRTI